MTFAAPAFLLALLVIPLAVAWYLLGERRATRARDAFAAPGVRESVAPRAAGWRRHAPMAGYALALAALALALARPQVTRAVPVQKATVILVIDRSGSMQARDVQPSRLAAARRAAHSFLARLPDNARVGAIAFNQVPEALQSPTTDHELIRSTIDAITPAGSTATGDALHLAVEMASRERPKPPPSAIVLLSDGKSVRGRDPMAAAAEAKQAGIPVYTVALGTPGGTIESTAPNGTTRLEPVPPDPETLRRIAEATGGETFGAGDADKLREVFDRLGRQVAREKRPREVTAAFAGGALLLLGLAAAASLRWFGRLP